MKNLMEISKYAGMREDIVQAGGGNSSVKHEDGTIAVKASGCQLAEVTEAYGFARMNIGDIKAFLAACPDEAACLQAEKRLLADSQLSGGRPSIEAFLHIVTPEKVTLHTHPVAVNFFACDVDWEQKLSALFPDALMIPYVTPGILLAREYVLQAQAHPDRNPCVAFFQNHGLLVSGQTAAEVIALTEDILLQAEAAFGMGDFFAPEHQATALHHTLQAAQASHGIVYRCHDAVVMEAAAKGPWPHQFCPDCIVYCGEDFLTMDSADDVRAIAAYGESHPAPPVVILIGGNCYINCASVKKAKEIESILRFSVLVSQNVDTNTSLRCLTREDQHFLLNWDAEKYRKNL